jgi:Protein of unknown function (DUF4239)
MTALYGIPAWLLLVLAMAIAAGLACAGQIAVRRAFPRVDFTAHNDVGGIVLGVVGGLFGVTLAFIIAIVWQEFDGTSQRAALEAGAATDLWHVASGLPDPEGRRVRNDLVQYADLMVKDEWPAMRSGRTSPRAEQLLTRTFESVARYRPPNSGAANAQSAALQYLGTLHDARHHRLDDNNSGVSPFEWVILVIGALAVVGLCYLVGLPDLRTQLLMTGAVAAMIAAMFTLIFELDYPFRGDLSVSSAPWTEFAAGKRADM